MKHDGGCAATGSIYMLATDHVVTAQVEMMVSTPTKCPITLDTPPVAPQITPCGHVFGFSGIIQHMMMTGGRELRCAAKCPLCFTPIVARELRSVVFQPVKPPKIGSQVHFQLFRRTRKSIIPEAVGLNDTLPGDGLRCNRFAKFTTVTDAAHIWRDDADQLAKTAAQVSHSLIYC